MDEEMRVEVTREDIDNGTRMSTEDCPVALALRRLPEVRRASVSDVLVRLETDDRCHHYELDNAGAMFLLRYDWRRGVEPACWP